MNNRLNIKRVTHIGLAVGLWVVWVLAAKAIHTQKLLQSQSVVIHATGAVMTVSDGPVDLVYMSTQYFAVADGNRMVIRSEQKTPPSDWPELTEYHQLRLDAYAGNIQIVESQEPVDLRVKALQPAQIVYMPLSWSVSIGFVWMLALTMSVSCVVWLVLQIPFVVTLFNFKPDAFGKRRSWFVFFVSVIVFVCTGLLILKVQNSAKYEGSVDTRLPDIQLARGQALAVDRPVHVTGAASQPVVMQAVDGYVNTVAEARPDGWPDPQYHRLPEGTMIGPGVYRADSDIRLILKPTGDIRYMVYDNWPRSENALQVGTLAVVLVSIASLIVGAIFFSL